MRTIAILTTIMMLFICAGRAYAQDAIAAYNSGCQAKNKSASFCNCSLKAFSDKRRKNDIKKLSDLKRYHADVNAQLMADPSLSAAKVDVVCDIYDEVKALDEKIAVARYGTPEGSALTAQKVALMNKKEQLIMSYGAKNNSVGSLDQGTYCEYRSDIARIEADIAADNSQIYPFVLRTLESNPPYSIIFRAAYVAGCQ